MRYALLFPLFYFAVVPVLSAQNLVPDPGFEIHTENCEGYPALVHWFNPNTATPDLWCVEGCGNILTPQLIQTSEVPGIPAEGSCYAGLYCAASPFSSYQTRDYLTTELLTPLQSGASYRVSFFLARRTLHNYAIDRIGVYFSFDAPLDSSFAVMEVEPQLETQGTILAPELEWMPIEFDYTADGSERFLTLGNFRELEDMTVEDLGTSWKDWDNSYYLFDDLIVEPSTRIEEHIDPILINFERGTLIVSTQQATEVAIMDLSGRTVIKEWVMPGTSSIQIHQLASGIFLCKVVNSSGILTKKFWKE